MGNCMEIIDIEAMQRVNFESHSICSYHRLSVMCMRSLSEFYLGSSLQVQKNTIWREFCKLLRMATETKD